MLAQQKLILFVMVVIVPTLSFTSLLILRRNVRVLVQEVEALWAYSELTGRSKVSRDAFFQEAVALKEKRLYGIFRSTMK